MGKKGKELDPECEQNEQLWVVGSSVLPWQRGKDYALRITSKEVSEEFWTNFTRVIAVGEVSSPKREVYAKDGKLLYETKGNVSHIHAIVRFDCTHEQMVEKLKYKRKKKEFEAYSLVVCKDVAQIRYLFKGLGENLPTIVKSTVSVDVRAAHEEWHRLENQRLRKESLKNVSKDFRIRVLEQVKKTNPLSLGLIDKRQVAKTILDICVCENRTPPQDHLMVGHIEYVLMCLAGTTDAQWAKDKIRRVMDRMDIKERFGN